MVDFLNAKILATKVYQMNVIRSYSLKNEHYWFFYLDLVAVSHATQGILDLQKRERKIKLAKKKIIYKIIFKLAYFVYHT